MKNYIIIGGSSGIGEEIVNLLDNNENNVIATYHNNKKENSEHINYINLNVLSDSLDLDNLPNEIHGIAYCPGSINLKPFKSFKEQDYIDDLKLQVFGATKIIQDLLPRLKKSKNASIVLFSTVAVQSGFAYHTQVAISKGAIEGLTKSLAAELAPSIRVNAIAPALTNTSLAGSLLNTDAKKEFHSKNNPLNKVGSPKDVAEAAIFLLSEKSSWVTGQIMHIDGGFSTIKK